jgi:phosphoribosylanthranilate isomerase
VKLGPLKDPLTTIAYASQKRKVSPEKPSARKKARANKPQSKKVLTVDDIELIITVVEDASEDIFQRHGAKQESMYDKIEKELKRHPASYPVGPRSNAYCAVLGRRTQNWGMSPPSCEG